MDKIRKYCAEFIGTFVLVLFACGVAGQTCAPASEGSGYLITALAFGLVIVAMAYSIGNISGCHINPAVSIAMLVNGKISLKDFCGYLIAQFLGGIGGAAVLYAIVKDTAKLGTNALYSGDALLSFAIEVILTFVFVIAGQAAGAAVVRAVRRGDADTRSTDISELRAYLTEQGAIVPQWHTCPKPSKRIDCDF